MAVITKISVQVKNKERYNIFLDGNYAFSIEESVLTKYQLTKGKTVDDLLLAEIHFENDVKKAVNKALNFLSYRMRTKKEIFDYLKKEDFDESYINEVFHQLEEYNYIDDQEFAKAFVNTQINTSNKGPDWIRTELYSKGVEQNDIEEALEPFTIDLQLQKCTALGEKLLHKYRKESLQQAKQKVETALIRKGYSHQIIKIMWEELEPSREEDEQWDALYHQGVKAHKRISAKYGGFEYVQKMKQTLYRKGFSIEQIERLIIELKDEDGY